MISKIFISYSRKDLGAEQGNVAAMRCLDEWEKTQRFSYKLKEVSLGTLCVLMWLVLLAN